MLFNRMHQPDMVIAESENEWVKLIKDSDGVWEKNGLTVSLSANQTGIEADLSLQSPKLAVKTVKLRWNRPMTGQLTIVGDQWERAYGNLEWRGIVAERVMPWYFLLYDGNRTDGFGVSTGPNAFCYWQADTEGITFTADVRNADAGVQLGNRMLKIARLLFHEGRVDESSFASAQRFCAAMCEHPLMPAQPVYGGNNWYYAYGNSTHHNILEDSRFISSLADSNTNRPFMVIDDGWQLSSGGGACNGGPWIGNKKFPDMEKLAAEMKVTGVKPGIWCRPLLTSQAVPQEWIRYEANNGFVLDPSRPEVLEHISSTISTLSAWGYDLIKHDFSTYDLVGKWGFEMNSNLNGISHPFHDRSKTTAEITMDLYRAISKASGNSMIIGCNTVSHMSAGLFEIQRTGDDTSGKSWERTRYMGINTLAFRMPQHGTFYSHDADCIGITSEVPWHLNRQWLDLLAGSGTPLFVSAAPEVVTKEQQAALRSAFDVASRSLPLGEPLDWMETTCPRRWLLDGKETEFLWNDPLVSASGNNDNHWWV
ncbi:alpha-galactosidase [Paenibacillus castaneae]|uniref:hypothetical protein n=1 Tax=Paenibacillus castaneae TaxID=474957 RepID=UPI001ABB9418|nr:hypothetical protein [Paenibacillus castaneae]NIK75169.1 alpha-galactosidase [Paenibacillus castaneae]